MSKETFILRTEWYDAIKELDSNSKSELLDNFFIYHLEDETKINLNNPLVNLVWRLIEPNLKRNSDAYDRRKETSRANGQLGGRPPKSQQVTEIEEPNENLNNLTKPNETLSVSVIDINNISSDVPKRGSGHIEESSLLIEQTTTEYFNKTHFVIAKIFHNLFLDLRGRENKTLKSVKTKNYVNSVRLLIENDKISIPQLCGLKLFLEDSKKECSKLNPFWADTIFSMDGFRGKSKQGVDRWDLICIELKKWQEIEGNQSRAKKLAESIEKKAINL